MNVILIIVIVVVSIITIGTILFIFLRKRKLQKQKKQVKQNKEIKQIENDENETKITDNTNEKPVIIMKVVLNNDDDMSSHSADNNSDNVTTNPKVEIIEEKPITTVTTTNTTVNSIDELCDKVIEIGEISNIGLTGGEFSYKTARYPRVAVLTNSILRTLDLNNYYWSIKLDGIHTIIKLTKNKLYTLDEDKQDWIFTQILDEDYTEKPSIFEAELMNDGVYNIFDILIYDGEQQTLNAYVDRLGLDIKMIPILKKKVIKPITNIQEVLDYGTVFHDNVDGVIITENNKPYFKHKTYKIKPPTMHTIDCLLKRNGSVYDMYVITTKIRKSLKQSIKLPISDHEFIQLDTPFMKPLTFDPSIKYEDNEKYVMNDNFKEEIKKLSDMDLDEQYVEMAYNGTQYYPVRLRTDTQKCNSYNRACTEIMLILSPLSLDDGYFQQIEITDENKEFLDNWHTFNKNIRETVVNNYVPEGESVYDIAGGSGQMLNYLLDKGYNNFFVQDIDAQALERYYNKAMKTSNDMYLNLFFKGLDNDISVADDIMSRPEFPNEGLDTAIISFALHYLCANGDESKITALKQILKRVMKKNTKLIVIDYDYDAIINLMQDNTVTLSGFNIRYEPENNLIYMPLPSIERDGTRSEPPLRKHHLDLLGFNYVTYKPIEYDETVPLTEYQQYVRVHVFTVC